MKRWALLLYPFLFVVARILQIADANPGQFSLGDLFTILAAIFTGVTGAIYALGRAAPAWACPRGCPR